MTRLCTKLIVGAAAAVCLSACQVQKSANPLSPAIAGPIEGVVISTPSLLEPGQDWEMRSRDQPLKLLFANAATNGVRPLKYCLRYRDRQRIQEHHFRPHRHRAECGWGDAVPAAGQTRRGHLLVALTRHRWREHRTLLARQELQRPRRSRAVAANAFVARIGFDLVRSDARIQGQGRQPKRRYGDARLHATGFEQLVLHVDRRDVHSG